MPPSLFLSSSLSAAQALPRRSKPLQRHTPVAPKCFRAAHKAIADHLGNRDGIDCGFQGEAVITMLSPCYRGGHKIIPDSLGNRWVIIWSVATKGAALAMFHPGNRGDSWQLPLLLATDACGS